MSSPSADRFEDGSGVSLATRTARGSIVNAAFLTAINVLGLVKGLVGATFLSAGDYGLWGLIGVTTALVLWLGSVGVDDKYIQQDHPDQERAFQVAFTLQCGLAALLALAVLVAMPLFALVYDAPGMVAPGLAMALSLPAVALQAPLWIFWRRMDFRRQRSLQIWDPVVSLLAVVALALAGLGVWALVIGTVMGSYAAAVAAVRASPYRLGWRYDGAALREYVSFSWPLFVASASGVLVAVVPLFAASRSAGIAAVGAITLATTIGQFAHRVDEVLTQALYPAICAVKDQTDLLFAAFSKSNRLALLWALPAGAAAYLFAGDFVEHVLGEKWRFAVTLIQIVAVTAAVNQIGFNWTAFYRALGRTWPIAVANVVLLAGVCAISVPLLVSHGIDGYGWGLAAATGLFLVARLYFLTRLFPLSQVVGPLARSAVPTVVGAGTVLALRAAEGGRGAAEVAGEGALFVAVVAATTVLSERDLLREMVGYLRGAPVPAPTV
ncbi:MAG TPA: oligosaccharide flippase family protein [Solirubrobacteraceae bacterium]|nr:oligosaccharide flippase family protein [Solirubrobacteraceae bacterium]